MVDQATGIAHIVKDLRWILLPSMEVENVEELISKDIVNKFNKIIEQFESYGSNWTFSKIRATEWTIVKYDKLTFYHGLGARGSDRHKNKQDRHKKGNSKPEELKALFATRGVIDVDNKGGKTAFAGPSYQYYIMMKYIVIEKECHHIINGKMN